MISSTDRSHVKKAVGNTKHKKTKALVTQLVLRQNTKYKAVVTQQTQLVLYKTFVSWLITNVDFSQILDFP
jgi:hypothetical protein